jgi:hypothetical protein
MASEPGPLTLTNTSTIEFLAPFSLHGFDESLPAGLYDIETELTAPADHVDPATWRASVLVSLHPRATHPGLARTLSVPLTEVEAAIRRDLLAGGTSADLFVQRMLDDPLVRLVMKSDKVTEVDLRQFYSAAAEKGEVKAAPD